MGDTIWVLKEGQESDDWDHSVLLREQKGLDRLAESLSVKKLSELFDFSAYAEEFGGPEEPNYLAPEEARVTLSALFEAVRAGHDEYKPKNRDELLEELEDCLRKIDEAEAASCRVRLVIIP
jgi:hypothetical protein